MLVPYWSTWNYSIRIVSDQRSCGVCYAVPLLIAILQKKKLFLHHFSVQGRGLGSAWRQSLLNGAGYSPRALINPVNSFIISSYSGEDPFMVLYQYSTFNFS